MLPYASPWGVMRLVWGKAGTITSFCLISVAGRSKRGSGKLLILAWPTWKCRANLRKRLMTGFYQRFFQTTFDHRRTKTPQLGWATSAMTTVLNIFATVQKIFATVQNIFAVPISSWSPAGITNQAFGAEAHPSLFVGSDSFCSLSMIRSQPLGRKDNRASIPVHHSQPQCR